MSTNTALDDQQASPLPDRVECLSGYTYADRPIAFISMGQKRRIKEILARWQIPGARRFRVRVDDDDTFELCYDEMRDEWQIVNV